MKNIPEKKSNERIKFPTKNLIDGKNKLNNMDNDIHELYEYVKYLKLEIERLSNR